MAVASAQPAPAANAAWRPDRITLFLFDPGYQHHTLPIHDEALILPGEVVNEHPIEENNAHQGP
jgi:hypothetical protein